MQVAIDGRWMIGHYRGMGRFAQMFTQPVGTGAMVFVPEGFAAADSRAIKRGPGFFPFWEQSVLPRLCRQFGVTHLVCPYNTGPVRIIGQTKLILVIHDLIYMESWRRLGPSTSAYQTLGRMYRRWIVPRVVRRADRIVTVTEYSRAQIADRFDIPRNRIEVIPNSVPDDWFVPTPLQPTARSCEILTVTGDAPSKNLAGLIQAYAAFKRQLSAPCEAPILRVIGIKPARQPYYYSIAERYAVADSVRFEPFLGDSELQAAYRQAALFVLPSLYEGFGIPIIEAMASGTPVVCSNTTALPEVLQEAGWLFDPRRPQDIAAVLLSAWLDQRGRETRALDGLHKAQRFRHSAVATRVGEFWRGL